MKAVALKEVCRIVNGGTPKSGVDEFWHGDVAWLTPAEMGKLKSPYVGQTLRTISPQGLANSSAKQVPAASVILSTRAPIGHLAINEVPMAFNQGCRGLVSNERLDTKYLYYFLWFSRDALDELGTGTTFKELSSSNLANFAIPLPPLEEQRQIVAVLDEAFAAIAIATANAQKNLTNARAVLDAHLKSIFDGHSQGWRRETLSQFMEVTHGFAFDGSDFSKSDDPSLPIVLTPGNYTENAELDFAQTKTKRLVSPVPNKFLFKEGDLTVVMTDLSSKMKILGKPAFVRHDNILHNQRIGRVFFKDDRVSPKLVYYFMRSEHSLQLIRSTATGTMVRHTAPSRILAISMAFPESRQEQEEIVGSLDAISECIRDLECNYQRRLADLSELKQSLLQRAFAGELT